MKLIKLGEIFKVFYGVNLSLSEVELANNGIPFVSRANRNNGVTVKVLPIEGIKPNPAHTKSQLPWVDLSCQVFIRINLIIVAMMFFYLQPMVNLSKVEMLLYCTFLRLNKYKYNYGRQANKSLESLYVPDVENIFTCLDSIRVEMLSNNTLIRKPVILDTAQWKSFRYGEIFTIKRGSYNRKVDIVEDGSIPLIGATKLNNGVVSKLDRKTIEQASKGSSNNHETSKKIFKGESYITISNNGSIGCAFYQPVDFACSQNVNLAELKYIKLNKYIALFLCTLIKLEKYRWTYGRKWIPSRMCESKIKLPINDKGEPDWQFMEEYIKSLPYNGSL